MRLCCACGGATPEPWGSAAGPAEAMVGVQWQEEGRGGGLDTDEEGEEGVDLGEATTLDWEPEGRLPAFVHAAGAMGLHNAAAHHLKTPARFKAGTEHKTDPVLPADAAELFELFARSLPTYIRPACLSRIRRSTGPQAHPARRTVSPHRTAHDARREYHRRRGADHPILPRRLDLFGPDCPKVGCDAPLAR